MRAFQVTQVDYQKEINMKVLKQLGIQHISVSHVQAWQASQAAWAARYLYEMDQPISDAMIVGKVVEEVLLDMIIEQHEYMEDSIKWENATSGMADKDIAKAAHMIKYGHSALVTYLDDNETFIVPQSLQFKVAKHVCPYSEYLPCIGYIDAMTIDGTIIEIKTTSRAPTNDDPKPAHMQQLAFYVSSMVYTRGKQDELSLRTPAELLLPSNPKGVILYCLARKASPTILREYKWRDQNELYQDDLESHYEKFYNLCSTFDYWLNRFKNEVDLLTRAASDTDQRYSAKVRRIISRSIPIDYDNFRVSGYMPSELEANLYGVEEQ